MDTTRHHDISEVGAKVIKAALKRSGRGGFRTGAFYLGNWLTDVQQFVDPPVYAKAHAWISGHSEEIAALFDKLLADTPSFLPGPFDEMAVAAVRTGIRDAHKQLLNELKALLESGGRLAAGFKAAFEFVGFYKFVNPDDGTANFKMDQDCYFGLFNERFRQYFPHEHLDRPETGERQFASEKAHIPANRWAEASPNAKCRANDLYTYLREDLKTVAGLLASLDNGPSGLRAGAHGWAAATFHRDRTEFVGLDGVRHPVADTDVEWNRHLALLGHALHAVEDFFGHSTFVEHASLAIPKEHARWQRKEDGLFSFLGLEEVLARRIKELRPGFVDNRDDWRGLPNDTHVATGYFDKRDTVISLVHALEELAGRPRGTVGASIDEVVDYDYPKLLRDTLELVSDPATAWRKGRDSNDEDGKNLAVKWLREKGGKGLELAEGDQKQLNQAVYLLVYEGPLRNADQRVKDAYSDAIRLLGRGAGVGMMGYTLYKLIKEVRLFILNPLVWLKKYLGEQVYGFIRKHGEVYAKMLVANAVGANRIGCHSLINKDSGPELFHADAMECAKAVHWYVVNTITRHAWPMEVAVARSSDRAAARQVLTGYRWVDWLELLEYFLDYPFAGVEVHAERVLYGTIPHQTQPTPGSKMSSDSLRSLAKKYSKAFVRVRGGPPALTWQVIADANFPTRGMSDPQRERQINKLLEDTNRGVVVEDGVNMAFRPGIVVWIPYQKATVPDASDAAVKDRWWYEVIMNNHRVIESWVADGRPGASAPAIAHRWMPIDRALHDQFVAEAVRVRQTMERAYNG